eukprot:6775409-Prymnesium_polylepis.1
MGSHGRVTWASLTRRDQSSRDGPSSAPCDRSAAPGWTQAHGRHVGVTWGSRGRQMGVTWASRGRH